MDNKTISSWVRQSRIKRKKYRSTPDCLTVDDLRKAAAAYNNLCAYCGVSEAVTFDHLFRFSAGGPNLPANIVPCCRNCKSMKDGMNVFEFYDAGYMLKNNYVNMLDRMAKLDGCEELNNLFETVAGVRYFK